MKKYIYLTVCLLIFAGCAKKEDEQTTVRIGWQTAWATQGQLIQAMERTNLSELCGINLTFKSFLFGPDLNEAAVTGNLDITNAGIVPVVNLLAANDNWIIVGRQVDFLLSVVARKESGVNTIKDLRGKKFGIPIAGGSHPYALQLIKEYGLEIGEGPDKVCVINVKPSEMPIVLKQGDVDAVACWEPTTTLAIDSGGKVIDERRYVGFICANKQFAQTHSEAMTHLLKAYILANYYVACNRNQTDVWYSKASGVSMDLIRRIKVIEPNVNAKSLDEIKILTDDVSIDQAQQVADIMKSGELISRSINMKERADMSYAKQAVAEIKKENINVSSVTERQSAKGSK